jgi:hypothetical protein
MANPLKPLRKLLNADPFTVFPPPFKGNHTILLSEEGIILADTHIVPGMEFGPDLSDQNISGLDRLAAKSLDPKTLSSAVPAVPGTASGFLVRHNDSSIYLVFL